MTEIKPGDKVYLIRQPKTTGVVRKVHHGEGKEHLTVETRGGYKMTTDATEWWILEEKGEKQPSG